MHVMIDKDIKFCPSCGNPSFVGVGKHFSCSDCGFDFYFNVAAAVAGFIEFEDSVIVTVRRNEPEAGKFDLPGGFVDPAESVEEALRREIREELNLELSALRYIGSSHNRYPYNGITYPTMDCFFVAQVDSLAGIHVEDDIAGYKLLAKEDLHEDIFPFESIKVGVRLYLAQLA